MASATLVALSWGGPNSTIHFVDGDESAGQARVEMRGVLADIVSRGILCRVNGLSVDDAVTYIKSLDGLGVQLEDLIVDADSLRLWTRIIKDECALYPSIRNENRP